MRIGIPRALYYYRYGVLWKTFFSALGCEVVVSPKTDRAILQQGTHYAIDESCLSAKIYLGHVAWLMDKCDYIFVPRIADMGRDKEFCLRFRAMPDVVYSTFREEGVRLVTCDIALREGKSEAKAFTELGKKLGFKKQQCFNAYLLAKQAEQKQEAENARKLDNALARSDLKVLICGHAYNIYDRYVGQPVLDAMTDEILTRRLKNIPILTMTLDGQDATAGMETRIESFIDILHLRKDGTVCL